jgi:hypothetical protein
MSELTRPSSTSGERQEGAKPIKQVVYESLRASPRWGSPAPADIFGFDPMQPG